MNNPEMIPLTEEKNISISRTTFMIEDELWKIIKIEKKDNNKMILNLEKLTSKNI